MHNVFVGWETYNANLVSWNNANFVSWIHFLRCPNTMIYTSIFEGRDILIQSSYLFVQKFYPPKNNKSYNDWLQDFKSVGDAKAFIESHVKSRGYKIIDKDYLIYV